MRTAEAQRTLRPQENTYREYNGQFFLSAIFAASAVLRKNQKIILTSGIAMYYK